jgi:hypothetical protein
MRRLNPALTPNSLSWEPRTNARVDNGRRGIHWIRRLSSDRLALKNGYGVSMHQASFYHGFGDGLLVCDALRIDDAAAARVGTLARIDAVQVPRRGASRRMR